jgi:alcohol dehydrogenase
MIVRGAVLREMGLPSPYAESRPLRLEEVELAPPGPGELLVRIRAAGLCHSDLSVIDGSRPRVMPMLLGHEATGEVIQSEAAGFAAGDTVGFAFVPACGACGPCAEGRAALCEPGAAANTAGTLLSGAHRLGRLAEDQPGVGLSGQVHHHLGVSGFADHAVVSARSAVKIDPDLPPEIAALFGCAVMTGVGAVVNTARVQAGQSAVVFGLGGVGLSALLGAVLVGAHPLVAVDVIPEKLELALTLGATHALDARSNDVVEQVREATEGGAHYAFETVGSAAVLGQAYAATRRGGTTVTVGLPHPSQTLSISAVSLVAEERTLKGSYLGSAIPSRDIPRYISLYKAGRLPVDRLLTSTVSLDNLNEAFDTLAAGTSIRQVLVL